MKKEIISITIFLLIGFIILFSFWITTNNDILETLTIIIGVTLYHFVMRLLVGAITNLIMKNNGDYQNYWFKEKTYEAKLYKFLRVRKWKKFIPTYDKDSFDTKTKTIKEIIGASCQAEIVHEKIMVLSLLPMIMIPFFNGDLAFIITSILSMLFDSLFVILQRYNRPRLIKVMNRFTRLKK